MRDKALDWLYANDPAARGSSRRAYAKGAGILGEAAIVDIRLHEVPLTESVVHQAHCRACARRSDVERDA